MQVIKGNQFTFFDVDDTIIMWDRDSQDVLIDGIWFTTHKGHLVQMYKHAARGHQIILWSAGGWEWAERVAVALGLDKDIKNLVVLEKPTWFYDDLRPEDFLGYNKYLGKDPEAGKDEWEKIRSGKASNGADITDSPGRAR